MFIKKLEMTGFKSFARKTAMNFNDGATIVVGPNGCGKSNVLDAMRWVLGSQSAKGLRGDKMMDVIFTGTEREKATSFAQVVLTLNNERGILPIDLSEVEIGRRLFRTGESEYLLNKTPCRLKDIHNLFLDTGGGANSYAIMEQGRVGEIVNMKPVDRMGIFEEAAGIAKYRVRRDETFRKLNRTEADLLRLNDLIFEIEGQVGTLRRQAQRAEQFQKLTAQRDDLDKRLMTARFRMIKSSFGGYIQNQRELSDQKTALETELHRLESENAKEQTEADTVTTELQERRERHYDVGRRIERLRNDIKLSEERMSTADARRAELLDEIVQLKKECAEMTSRREELLSESGGEKQELDALATRRSELKDALERERSNHDEVMASLVEMRTRSSEHQTKKYEAENTIRVNETLIERLKESINDLETEEKKTGRIAAAAWEELNSLRRDLQRAEQEHAEVSAELEKRLTTLKDLRRSQGEAELHRQQLITDVRRLETRHETLKQLQDSYEGYYKGVKTIMKAAQKEKLSGVVGTFSELIRIPEKFELALETALGGDLQDIVMDSVENVKAAVEYLKTHKGGRATFLPLDHLRPYSMDENLRRRLPGEKGVFDWASELVESDEKIRKAVDFLLSSTLIVEDMDSAVALQRAGHSVRCVTLKGEIFHPRGKVTGGEARTQELLKRNRELRDLPRAIETARFNLDDTIKEIHALETEVKKVQDEVDGLQTRLNGAEVEIGSAKNVAFSLEGRFEKIKGDQKSLQDKIEKTNADIKSANEAITEARQAVARHADEFKRLNEAAGEIEQSINDNQGHLEKITEELNTLNVKFSGQQERHRATIEKLEALDEEIRRRTVAADSREADRNRLSGEGEAQADNKKSAEEELVTLLAEDEELSRWIESTSQRHNELAGELKQLTDRLQTIQRDLNQVTNNLHEVELKISDFTAQERLIGEQAFEKFNVPLEELLSSTEGEEQTIEELEETLRTTRNRIDRLGNVNPGALDEYNAQKERLEFLTGQRTDMEEAKAELESTIEHIDKKSRQLFLECFEEVRGHFVETYMRLFEGGKADLILTTEETPDGESRQGVEIVAQPPGKKLRSIHLLSGGEKALTAISLMFALFLHRPAPYCILDEIDAPLDDVNVSRFVRVVREFSDKTQFIVITHNKLTMDLADTIYGVTMQEKGISNLVSVKFEDLEKEALIS